MKAIGFRAEKLCIRFVVLQNNDGSVCIVADGKIDIGEKRPIAGELALLRTRLLNLLKEQNPDCCGMRLSDNPQRMNHAQSLFCRARIEGVCMEVIGELNLTLKAGASTTMKAGMGTKTPLKKYLALDEIRGINLTGRGQKAPEYREAVIAALAAIGGSAKK